MKEGAGELLKTVGKTNGVFYWLSLVISTFLIINIVFDPFEFLIAFGTGIFSSIALIFYLFMPDSFIFQIDSFLYMIFLSIASYPFLFYFLYKKSKKKIYPIHFLWFINFVLLAIATITWTLYVIYGCVFKGEGSMGCVLPIVTIPIIIISSLVAYFFYYKSEGLK
ncbi:MAG: hypothetical protein ABFQ65_00710 [Nanoarchaeota archaeon]